MPEVAYADVQAAIGDQPITSGPPSSIAVADAQKLGVGSPIQYTEPKPAPNLAERVGEDLTKPFIQTQHTFGALTSWLGSNIKDQTPFGALGDRVNRAGIILQERASANLAKNYSNFTPNMLDDLIGAVPTIAGLIGATAAGVPGAVTAGVLATAGGLGIASEEFNKFKMQGKSTPEADKLAAMIGVPVGGVMAAGFGVVGKLVEPWFKGMLGATISKIAGDAAANMTGKTVATAAAGAAGFGAQAAVQDTGEFATGAEPFTGVDSIVKGLTDTAHNAIMGGVLGGALGMHFAFQQHARFEAGLKQLGLDDAQAKQTTNDVLGQGSHALLDAVEKHLDYTADETSRIQAPPTSGEVRPNILVKGGIPNDLLYPSVEPLPKENGEVTDLSKDFKYVKLYPLDLQAKLSDKATAEDIRSKFVGGRDKSLADGVYLYQDLKKLVPSSVEQSAMFFSDAPAEFVQKALDNPVEAAQVLHMRLRELHGESIDPAAKDIEQTAAKLKDMKPVLEKLLNPSDQMKAALTEGKRYYDEQGVISKAFGTINEIRENYHSSRLYKPEPLSDYVKLTSVTKRFSAHSLQRHYPTNWDALADGKEFQTTSYAEALLAHNQEMVAVNYSRQMINAASEVKPMPLISWVREGALPRDWQQVGTTKKLILMKDPRTGEVLLDENKNQMRYYKVAASPKGIADGLKPLTDPNYMKLIPGWKTANRIQGIAKTGILSYSFFHHATFAAQTMASLDGYKTLSEIPKVLKDDLMSEPAFREQERRFLGANGSTTITHTVQDVLRDINVGDDAISKVLRAPVAKQLTDLSNANTKLLFDGMQRYMKVTTFSRNMAKWEGQNPEATPEQLREAELGYAKATNAEFGGLNWEALGVNRTVQALLRFFLLAPDWVVSNTLAAKYAVSDAGTAGSQARWTLGSAVLGGIVLNNALNYMRTGHSTFENKKGHMLEAEVAPDVYVNSIRGAPGELMKVGADMIESEGAPGFARYAEGKLSPMMSAFTTGVSGINYFGQSIWKGDNALQKNVNGFWNILTHLTPVPIGVTGAVSYAQREQEQSPLGWGLISMGLGRFSKPSESQEKGAINDKVIRAYRAGNSEYVDQLINKGDLSQEQADKLKSDSELSVAELHVRHMKIDKAFEFYAKASEQDKKDIRDIVEDKYQRFLDSDASANQKKKVEKLYKQFNK